MPSSERENVTGRKADNKSVNKHFMVLLLVVLVLITGINVYNFIQSKFSRHINPEAIVVIGNIQTQALKHNVNDINDERLRKITKSVVAISKQEEDLNFKGVYKRIEKLGYYDLPPLYWDQLDEIQKRKAFSVWEDYMKYLMSQCEGNEYIKFSTEEIERCVELKKRQIEERKKALFD